jgi:hypothetical protein
MGRYSVSRKGVGGRPRTIEDARSVTFDIAGEDLEELLRLVDDEKLTLAQLLRFVVRGYLDAHPRRERREARTRLRGAPAR